MIDIDHGSIVRCSCRKSSFDTKKPSRDGWGCLVFGPMLLRFVTTSAAAADSADRADSPHHLPTSPHGRGLGQLLSQIAPMQPGNCLMRSRRSSPLSTFPGWPQFGPCGTEPIRALGQHRARSEPEHHRRAVNSTCYP